MGHAVMFLREIPIMTFAVVLPLLIPVLIDKETEVDLDFPVSVSGRSKVLSIGPSPKYKVFLPVQTEVSVFFQTLIITTKAICGCKTKS